MMLIIIDGAIYTSVSEVSERLGLDYDEARRLVARTLGEDKAWSNIIVLEGAHAVMPSSILGAVNATKAHAQSYITNDRHACIDTISNAKATIKKQKEKVVSLDAEDAQVRANVLKSHEYIKAMGE